MSEHEPVDGDGVEDSADGLPGGEADSERGAEPEPEDKAELEGEAESEDTAEPDGKAEDESESESEPESDTPSQDPASPPKPKRFRKLKITALSLAVLLVLVVGGGSWYVYATIRDSLPQVSGTLHLPGLDGRVEVDRNAQGVPQVYASTPHDLFYAQGFVQAQDRMWQMDVYRHITAGRLAEIFGSDQVDTDKFIRTMGWYAIATKEYDALKPETKASLQSFSDGVNAYLADHKGSKASAEYAILGLQYDYTAYAWTPVDSIAWLKALAWDLRDNMDSEISRSLATATLTPAQVDQLYVGYPYGEHPTIVHQGAVVNGVFDQNATASTPPGPPQPLPSAAMPALAAVQKLIDGVPAALSPNNQGVGSNSWVVSGSLTTTGKPMLANDPHLSPELPQIWYQMGLHCTNVSAACPYDVAGFTMPGEPGVLIGHTDKVAWGFTNGTEDVSDLVLEKVTGDTYEYDGQQLPLTEHQETIKVAGGKPVTITIRATQHGPLVSDAGTDEKNVGRLAPVPSAGPGSGSGTPERGDGYAVALRWTALTPTHTADALFEVDKAENWDEFRAAAQDFAVPSQNMIYADTSGNIGYQTPGSIPIRKSGDGAWPVPGWTDAYDWTGYIPFDALPHELNPSDGFVATANNSIIGADYPYLLSAKDFDHGYRANEITQRINAATSGGAKIDADGMRAIQGDTRNEFASVLVPYLKSAAVSPGTAAKAKALFDAWDDTTPPDSAAAAYFYEVWKYLLQDAVVTKLPSDVDVDGGDRWYAAVDGMLKDPTSFWWTDTASTSGTGDRDKVLAEAMNQAADDLSQKQGGDPSKWQWGKLHTLTPTNQTLGTAGPWFVKDLLNGDPLAVGGGAAIVDANSFDISKDFSVDESPSMRMLVDLGDLDRSTWVNLTGASGHVMSANYLDQAPLWRDLKTLPWAHSAGAVKAATKNTLVLMPK